MKCIGKTWIKNGKNMLLYSHNFYVSFNPDTSNLGSAWQGDDTSETALVINHKYYVLNGDHREAFEKTHDDLDESINLFLKLSKEYLSSWSNDIKDLKVLEA